MLTNDKIGLIMGNNKLVQTTTEDGLYLHGYYVPAQDKKIAILHIHGLEGNFYENNFVYVLADTLEKEGIGFLTVNTRGNGKDTNFNTVNGEFKRVGSRYELLEDAHKDITAWLEFLIDEGYEQLVLQGHSLGTIKSIRYLFEGKYKDKLTKLILLSPFDNKALMNLSGRTDITGLLAKAQKIVDDGKGEELITKEFDDVSCSYRTFISWNKQDYLGRMFDFCNPSYDFPALKKINLPTKIIVGSVDEYFHQSNPKHPEEAMNILLNNIPNSVGKIIEGASHSYAKHESTMATEIISFLKNEDKR